MISTNTLNKYLCKCAGTPSGEMFKEILFENIDFARKQNYKNPMITYEDLNVRIPYVYRSNMRYSTIHLGQRKLFLTELEFFNVIGPHYTKNKNQVLCIYAGAAPSNHTWLLSELFPRIKWLLIDPNVFDLTIDKSRTSHRDVPNDEIIHITYEGKTTKDENKNAKIKNIEDLSNLASYMIKTPARFTILQDFMTDELADILHELHLVYNILFISDIRTLEKGCNFPSNYDIIWNSAMQFSWISRLKPDFYMVKYRTPYLNNVIVHPLKRHENIFNYTKSHGIDFLNDYAKKRFTFLDGTIHIQCFHGSGSLESRLIGRGDVLKFKTIDMLDFEERMFALRVNRGFAMYKNENATRELFFDHCNDCAKENHLWKEYLKSTTSYKANNKELCALIHKDKSNTVNVRDLVRMLSIYTRPLNYMGGIHGRLFKLDEEFILVSCALSTLIDIELSKHRIVDED